MNFQQRLLSGLPQEPAEQMANAQWIDPELKHSSKERQPVSYLKKTFSLKKTGKALLHITAHGIYDAYINGVHVDGYLFAPGSSQYDKRLQVQSYDVSDLLHGGDNELIVTLGDGWYRGCCHNEMQTNCFGKDVALLCCLDADGYPAVVSDQTWQASQSGPIGRNDMMQGEEVDARREISDWHSVTVKNYNRSNLVRTETCPVTPHEEFAAKPG